SACKSKRKARTPRRSPPPLLPRSSRSESPRPPARKFPPAQFASSDLRRQTLSARGTSPSHARRFPVAARRLAALLLHSFQFRRRTHRLQLLFVDARPHVH